MLYLNTFLYNPLRFNKNVHLIKNITRNLSKATYTNCCWFFFIILNTILKHLSFFTMLICIKNSFYEVYLNCCTWTVINVVRVTNGHIFKINFYEIA